MKKNILIVDDSQTQLKSLKMTLLKAGYDVKTASNGAEGICAAYETLPDLIICDIIMPEIDGYQLCRLLKNDKLTKNIPIILLTSLNENIDKFWGLRAGADVFIVKSENPTILLDNVTKFMHNSSGISEEERKTYLENRISNVEININSKIKDLLDQSLIESTIINEFRNLSEFILSSTELTKSIFSLLFSILDYSVAGIFFNEIDKRKERLLSINTCNAKLNKKVLEDIKNDFFSEVFKEKYTENPNYFACESIEDAVCNSAMDNTEFKNKEIVNDITDLKSKMIFPIVYEGKVYGGICFYHTETNKFAFSRIFNIIIEEIKLLMRVRWLYSETKFLSITDGLTGLYNRRYFQQALEREFARARRYKNDVSIFMLDIDHFKQINDNYGHQFGDKVIAEISAIIKNSLRKTDYIARYGGEEIVAILPETNIERALIPIERLRKTIEMHDFKYMDQNVRVTVSIGVSQYPSDIDTIQELIAHADKALYEAKESGRNRTNFYLEAKL